MHITSLQNPRIKQIVKLRADKRQRQHDGLMLVEGYAEIQLALACGHRPRTLIRAPDLAKQEIRTSEGELLTVTSAVFDKISHRENPDGWLGVFPIPRIELSDLRLQRRPLLIVAEAVEKPGNLGAMLRTADAAGVDALLACDPRVDIHNPNVVRASRGTLFSVPTVETTNPEALAFLKKNGIRVLAATPNAGMDFTRLDMKGPVAIALGSEDQGLSEFWLSQADVRATIPMVGKANSLNVSIAAALIVYEALRQRGVAESKG